MKILLDLRDEFIEEELLTEAFRDAVMRKVLNEIITRLSARIDQLFNEAWKAEIDRQIPGMVQERIAAILDTSTVKIGGREMTLQEVVRARLDNYSGWITNGEIDKIAHKHAGDLRNRYDLAYATNLVVGLSKQGLLKAELVALLNNPETPPPAS